MSDYVDALFAEQGNANGLLLEVLTSGYEQWDYLFAVEGPSDKKFYYDFLNVILPEADIQFIECSGKENLLKFKNAVESYQWVDPPKFRYLADKDFDDYLGIFNEGVWKTPWYSIESYLTCAEYIDYCLRKYGPNDLTPILRGAFVSRYEQIFVEMASSLRSFSAYICEVRSNKEHPTFDDFGIDKLFHLDRPSAPKRVGNLNAAIVALGVTGVVSRSRILSRTRSFALDNISGWLRGKLALQVARKSYERAKQELPDNRRALLPAATFLAGDALGLAFTCWKTLAELDAYCQS